MQSISIDEELLEAVKDVLGRIVEIETNETSNDTRREKTLDLLMELTKSNIAYWAAGHGHPMHGQIAPLTWVPRGIPSDIYGDFLQIGLSPLCDQWIRAPFLEPLKTKHQVCRSRSQFHSDETWRACEFYRNDLVRLGIDSWMIAVRYPNNSTWSSITLFRPVGESDYSPVDRAIVDIVMSCKSWLHFRLSEDGSANTSQLSPRNATVLLLLLDGYSRKEIAAQMDLTLHIVNDSIKAIYRHFGTSSATELAAKFLRRA